MLERETAQNRKLWESWQVDAEKWVGEVLPLLVIEKNKAVRQE